MNYHTELYCKTLSALSPVEAVRAIHAAYLQLTAATAEANLDNRPAMAALAACLRAAGHPGFQAARPKGSELRLGTCVAEGSLEARLLAIRQAYIRTGQVEEVAFLREVLDTAEGPATIRAYRLLQIHEQAPDWSDSETLTLLKERNQHVLESRVTDLRTKPAAGAPGIIRCLVAAVDANGAAVLYPVRVLMPEAQIAEGEHYEAARTAAMASGYELWRGTVVMDEREQPALFDAVRTGAGPLFDWAAAPLVGNEPA